MNDLSDCFYSHTKTLTKTEKATYKIEGIRRKKAWLPEVHLPGLEDRETAREHKITIDRAEQIITVLMSGARFCSRAINDLLNNRMQILELSVKSPDDGAPSFGSYNATEMTLWLDWVVCRRYLKEENGRLALLGLWAHEVGHALTIPSDVSRMCSTYLKKKHFEERDRVNELHEQAAEDMARALGFETAMETRNQLNKKIGPDVEMERGFLE